MNWDWDTIIPTLIPALISSFAIIVSALITRHLLKQQIDNNKKQHEDQSKFNKKQHQVRGLLEAFNLLDSEKHRECRKKVFSTYFQYFDNGDLEIFRGENKSAIATVMADFDVMGKLVDSENIDRIQFLEEYSSLAYRCWKLLDHHINQERDDRNFRPFMTWFQWLSEQGYNYWKNERAAERCDLDDTVLLHPDDPKRKISFRKLRELKRSPA